MKKETEWRHQIWKKLHFQSVFHMFCSWWPQTEYITDWPNYILVGPKLPNRKSSQLPLNMDQFEKILYIQKIILIHSVTTTTYYITSSVCLLRISAALCLAWKQKKTFDQIYKNLFVNSSKRQSQELDFRRWKHNSKVVYFWQWRNFFFMPSIFFSLFPYTFVLITVLEFVALKKKFLTYRLSG